jgi:hypothetical protein
MSNNSSIFPFVKNADGTPYVSVSWNTITSSPPINFADFVSSNGKAGIMVLGPSLQQTEQSTTYTKGVPFPTGIRVDIISSNTTLIVDMDAAPDTTSLTFYLAGSGGDGSGDVAQPNFSQEKPYCSGGGGGGSVTQVNVQKIYNSGGVVFTASGKWAFSFNAGRGSSDITFMYVIGKVTVNTTTTGFYSMFVASNGTNGSSNNHGLGGHAGTGYMMNSFEMGVSLGGYTSPPNITVKPYDGKDGSSDTDQPGPSIGANINIDGQYFTISLGGGGGAGGFDQNKYPGSLCGDASPYKVEPAVTDLSGYIGHQQVDKPKLNADGSIGYDTVVGGVSSGGAGNGGTANASPSGYQGGGSALQLDFSKFALNGYNLPRFITGGNGGGGIGATQYYNFDKATTVSKPNGAVGKGSNGIVIATWSS